MTRRLRILYNCKNKLFYRIKTRLATNKEITDLQALQIIIERAEEKIKKKKLKEINSIYQEKYKQDNQ